METPSPSQAPEDDPPIPGIRLSASHFLASLLRHFQALFALFALESREAGGQAARIAVAFIGALILVIFAYVFALLFLIFLLNVLFGIAWIWICLGVAILHVLGAAGCLWFGKEALKKKFFESTADVIRKDIEALKSTKS